jgi:hypothetical protein
LQQSRAVTFANPSRFVAACISLATLLACASQVDEVEPPTDMGYGGRPGSSSKGGGAGSTAVSTLTGGAGGQGGNAGSGASGGSPSSGGGSGAGASGSAGSEQGGSTSGGSSGGQAGNTVTAGSSGSGGEPAVTCSQSFVYEGEGGAELESVHVSGSFNAWADPGTALVHDGDSDRWALELELAAGSYQYKFVLDGSDWIADPNNSETEGDGYGGINSIVVVTCP